MISIVDALHISLCGAISYAVRADGLYALVASSGNADAILFGAHHHGFYTRGYS